MSSLLSTRSIRQEVPDACFGLVIGVDVAKGKMDYAAFRPSERSPLQRSVRSSEGFEELLAFAGSFRDRGYDVWIAYEPTGPYSYALGKMLESSEFRVVLVNPYHVKRTKEVRDNSPEKSDYKDPGVIADLVWQGCYQQPVQVSGVYAELRYAYCDWVSAAKQIARLRNECRSILEMWFPELGDIFADPLCKSGRALLRYESVSAIGASRLRAIEALVRKASAGRVSKEKARAIHRAAKESVGACDGAQSLCLHMRRLLSQIEELERHKAEIRGRMQSLLSRLPESAGLLSVPYVGVVVAAGLLGECGDLRRFDSYACLEKHLGLNLFEVSSGTHKGERHISKRGRFRGRYLLCSAAAMQMRRGGIFHEYATGRKSEGMRSKKVMVAVARKLLAIFYAIVRDGSMYEPNPGVTEGTRDGQGIRQGTQLMAA